MNSRPSTLYFTAMANGNSRMYRAEHFEPLVERAGLTITERINDIGLGHSMKRKTERVREPAL